MKIRCDFCKTEYHIDNIPNMPVQCAVCGHTWNVAIDNKKNSWLMFFASLCALLSAIVFTVAIITQHQIKQKNQGPLIATVTSVTTSTDENGISHVVVNGTVTNISNQIYGVPDLLIVSSDDKGNVLAQQKFMPSATLLDVGASVKFSHMLSHQPSGVKKISAKLVNFDITKDEKK
jgi:predicted Zn finger-like uncharacterized protein